MITLANDGKVLYRAANAGCLPFPTLSIFATHRPLVHRFINSITYSESGSEPILSRHFFQKLCRIGTGEFPFKRLGNGFEIAFQALHSISELRKRFKIIWCKNFSLKNREINLDLIQPTGMNRAMNRCNFRIFGLNTVDGIFSSMRRPVIDDQENPSRFAVSRTFYDFVEQTRRRARCRIAPHGIRRLVYCERQVQQYTPKSPYVRIHARLS